MRFLCLHGMGTNSMVFEIQTAALRRELGDQHTYDFVEGSVPCPVARAMWAASYVHELKQSHGTEIESIFPADDEYYAYYDPRDAASIHTALDDLAEYISAEGPFDAVLAFSMGAGLAAAYLAHQQMLPDPQFLHIIKCAVFISGGQPFDYAAASRGEIRKLDVGDRGEVISIPTANIWGSNDTVWPGSGVHLAELCRSQGRTNFVHEGGHEVPGSSRSSRSMMPGAVQAIRATVEAALLVS